MTSVCQCCDCGRHVCANYKNVTYPVKTTQVVCKPTYKKYMVRCGDQWCEGVKLVYEKYRKEVMIDTNGTRIDYTCCPGWSQVTYRSYGCNKPVCEHPCQNGGKCVKPNCCSCPPGYTGEYCETSVTYFDQPRCFPSCLHGGTCHPSGHCLCSQGYTGSSCEKDVDECKIMKPCDHICYNTPGSYTCECKENFSLQQDGQSCRKEDGEDETTFEAKDLEYQQLDKRLARLERMMSEKHINQVSKKDIALVYHQINEISDDIADITNKLKSLDILNSSERTKSMCQCQKDYQCQCQEEQVQQPDQ